MKRCLTYLFEIKVEDILVRDTKFSGLLSKEGEETEEEGGDTKEEQEGDSKEGATKENAEIGVKKALESISKAETCFNERVGDLKEKVGDLKEKVGDPKEQDKTADIAAMEVESKQKEAGVIKY